LQNAAKVKRDYNLGVEVDKRLKVFIASASEGLEVANLLRDCLKSDRIDAEVWDQDTFQSSLTFIESLEEKLDQSDCAIVALTPDDRSISRGKLQLAPRDNAIFELGFFMGRLGAFGRMGRLRTFFVASRVGNLKIPTDLLGVEPVLYECREGEALAAAIGRACEKLKAKVIEHGPRERPSPEQLRDRGQLLDFCRRVEGAWWARVVQGSESKVGHFSVAPDYATSTVRLEGRSIDALGTVLGEWNSLAAGIRPRDRTLFYSWEGRHGLRKGFEGFGQYTFFDAPGQFVAGNGLYADIQSQGEMTRWVQVEVRRIDATRSADVRHVVEMGTDEERSRLVKKALGQFAARRQP